MKREERVAPLKEQEVGVKDSNLGQLPSLVWESLPIKLGRYSVLVALILGLLFSLIQVGIDFRNERQSIDIAIQQHLATLEKSAAEASYQLDVPQGQRVLEGLFVFPSVYRAEIIDDFGDVLVQETRGEPAASPRFITRFLLGEQSFRQIDLVFEQDLPVGIMRIWLDLDLLTENFRTRVWFIVFSGILRNLFLAAVLAVMFHLLLARPLVRAVARLREPLAKGEVCDPPPNDHSPIIHRKGNTEILTTGLVDIPRANTSDELGQLLSAINEFILGREQAMQALKDSEERYRSLIESQTDLVCRFAPEGALIFVNEVYCQFFNQSKEELIGVKWQSLLLDHDAIEEKLSQLSPANPMVIIENRVSSIRGDIHWVQFANSGFFDCEGNLLEIQSVGRDITERKQFEEALRESEEKYRTIFENAVEGFYQSTRAGRFISVNPALAKIFNYASPQEIIENISDIANQLYADPGDRDRYQQILEQTNIVENFEFEARRKDGSLIWVSDSARIYRDEQGEIIRYDGIVTDITERKKLENQLLQSQKMDALGTLAGGIAHEFNNILGVIQGQSHVLLKQLPENSAEKQKIAIISQAGERATDLVKQILTFSRMDELQHSVQEIPALLKESLKMIRATLPATIEIQQNIAMDCPPILADPTQIHQIIMNLCTNAFHAMEKDGGVLRVSLQHEQYEKWHVSWPDLEPGSYLKLTVQDSGCGIPDDIKAHIFDPFFTTKEVGKGTGIGLSVVHSIVSQHGGAIMVESQVADSSNRSDGVGGDPHSGGSTFHIYFPAVQETIMEEKIAEKEPLTDGMGKIMVVDDEPFLAGTQKITLEEFGYEVTVFHDGLHALAAFQEKPDQFDLVFTDYTLPQLTGDKLSQEFLRIRPDLPIILTTGYNPDISEEKAKALGIRAFMMKPIDNDELVRTIQKLLEK